MNLELIIYVGIWTFIILFAYLIRRMARGSKMTSFMFLDKGGPFVYRVYDIAKKWRGIPLQFPALGWVEPKEDKDKEKKKGWSRNDFYKFLVIIIPLLIIFIGLGLAVM